MNFCAGRPAAAGFFPPVKGVDGLAKIDSVDFPEDAQERGVSLILIFETQVGFDSQRGVSSTRRPAEKPVPADLAEGFSIT